MCPSHMGFCGLAEFHFDRFCVKDIIMDGDIFESIFKNKLPGIGTTRFAADKSEQGKLVLKDEPIPSYFLSLSLSLSH